MNLEQFKEVDVEGRGKSPSLFRLTIPDPPASESEIERVERLLGTSLPASFKEFLMAFGGGNFGLVTTFSAAEGSEWFMPRKVSEARESCPASVLPFADDFAGGFYVFPIQAGKAGEAVWYWNTDGGLSETAYKNVFDYLARFAYRAA